MNLSVFNQSLTRGLYWGTALSAGLFFLVVIAGVAARYLLRSPLSGSVELGRLLFVWACFLGAGLAYRQKAHIAISLFTDRLPLRWQAWLFQFRRLATLALMALITYSASQVIWQLWFSNLPVLGISQGWFYLPVPLTTLAIACFALEERFSDEATSD